MVIEKAVYWMGVGVLALGLCNTLTRNLDSVRGFAGKSIGMGNTLSRTREIKLMDSKVACARARMDQAVSVLNFVNAGRVKNDAIRARMAAHCAHSAAPRPLRNLVVAVSDSSIKVMPASM